MTDAFKNFSNKITSLIDDKEYSALRALLSISKTGRIYASSIEDKKISEEDVQTLLTSELLLQTNGFGPYPPVIYKIPDQYLQLVRLASKNIETVIKTYEVDPTRATDKTKGKELEKGPYS